MKSIRLWALWRRIQYGTGFSLVMLLLGVGIYYQYFYVAPQCFDGVHNGTEAGLDCGGDCIRVCAHQVTEPVVEWVESFEIAPYQYNVVAYIQNQNDTTGTRELPYVFSLYDDQNQLITERSGVTPLPPNGTYAIFEGRIATNNREVDRTEIRLLPIDIWQPFTRGKEHLRIGEISLSGADAQPRLNASIENTSLEEENDIDVVATIFNSQGVPLTSSRTYLDTLSARSEEGIVFTWPNPIASTVRSCIVPSDIMMILDRSGSMAADGGDPPEPLESAKQAASQFVSQTKEQDQVGFVSYATTPSSPIEQNLTRDKSRTQEAISDTVMGTDGTQYTDMGAVFSVAADELRGPRARADARKIIVFLTDGDVTRPVNPETGQRDIEFASQYALAQAEEAKNNGVIVYSIGFGDFFLDIDNVLDRDLDLIEDLASSPEQSFIAPTINDLRSVYTDIAEDICEDGPTRIDILPIFDNNFVPLR